MLRVIPLLWLPTLLNNCKIFILTPDLKHLISGSYTTLIFPADISNSSVPWCYKFNKLLGLQLRGANGKNQLQLHIKFKKLFLDLKDSLGWTVHVFDWNIIQSRPKNIMWLKGQSIILLWLESRLLHNTFFYSKKWTKLVWYN